jgi:hypothetical protein
MKLTTIWTLPAMTLRERLARTNDALTLALAHRLPRRLAYWSFIDTGVRHIEGNEVVPDVRYTDLLKRAGVGVETA